MCFLLYDLTDSSYQPCGFGVVIGTALFRRWESQSSERLGMLSEVTPQTQVEGRFGI